MIERIAPDIEGVLVVRDRAATLGDDRAVLDAIIENAAETRVPAVRVWTPHQQVAFGRLDSRADGYERARDRAAAQGYPPIERRVGGRAVAYTGSTVAFAIVIPSDEPRRGIEARYDAATTGVVRGLRELGVSARRGEPEASFCPGAHSVQASGKIAGIAQRVRQTTALVAGTVVVDGHEAIATVIESVYRTLDVPFDPDTVGSVQSGGGPGSPERVVEALLDVFCGDLSRQSVATESLAGE